MSNPVTSTLNDLIETLKDGQEGFRTAAEDVKSQSVKELFGDCSLQRHRFITELQDLSRSLGEEHPADSTSLTGKLHRGWINLKSVLLSKDEQAILNECERGEDSAVSHYRKALATDLPEEVRSVVQTQFEGIQAAHDKVRDARDRWAEKV